MLKGICWVCFRFRAQLFPLKPLSRLIGILVTSNTHNMHIEYQRQGNGSLLSANGSLLYSVGGENKLIVPCTFQETSSGPTPTHMSMICKASSGIFNVVDQTNMDDEASKVYSTWIAEWAKTSADVRAAIVANTAR